MRYISFCRDSGNIRGRVRDWRRPGPRTTRRRCPAGCWGQRAALSLSAIKIIEEPHEEDALQIVEAKGQPCLYLQSKYSKKMPCRLLRPKGSPVFICNQNNRRTTRRRCPAGCWGQRAALSLSAIKTIEEPHEEDVLQVVEAKGQPCLYLQSK